MKKKIVVDSEQKRQLVLDLAKVIADSGDEGVSLNELVLGVNSDFDNNYVIGVIRRDLVACLGKITRGERRWSRYYIDDLDIAVKLINDHFDRKMNDLQLWELYADIAEYIKDTPAVTDKMVTEEFGIDLEVLDKMNSDLVEYGSNLDFHKLTANGTKVRLGDNTLTVIDARINALKPKCDKVKVEEKKNLIPLPEDQKRMIQERILHIIYYFNKISIKDIAAEYKVRFNEDLKFLTIRSFMDKMPGIYHYNEVYQVKDINAALEHINPIKSIIRIDVALKSGTDVSAYKNMRYSRTLGDYDIYILEDKTSYNVVTQVLDLILIGASIDSKIVDQVKNILKINMSIGHKIIL